MAVRVRRNKCGDFGDASAVARVKYDVALNHHDCALLHPQKAPYCASVHDLCITFEAGRMYTSKRTRLALRLSSVVGGQYSMCGQIAIEATLPSSAQQRVLIDTVCALLGSLLFDASVIGRFLCLWTLTSSALWVPPFAR